MTSLIRPQLLLIPLLLATGGLQAMTVTRSATPPQGGMLLARDVANDVGSYECSRGLGAEVQAGQTFRLATAVDLARITVRVRPMTDVAGKQLVLFFGTFSGPGDETMDELLATELGKLPATLPVGEITYLTFDIADRQLAAGQQYGFVFGFSGGDHPGEADLDVLHLGANGYADGTAVEWSGLQETALANDLVVFLQGTAESEDPPDSAGSAVGPVRHLGRLGRHAGLRGPGADHAGRRRTRGRRRRERVHRRDALRQRRADRTA